MNEKFNEENQPKFFLLVHSSRQDANQAQALIRAIVMTLDRTWTNQSIAEVEEAIQSQVDLINARFKRTGDQRVQHRQNLGTGAIYIDDHKGATWLQVNFSRVKSSTEHAQMTWPKTTEI